MADHAPSGERIRRLEKDRENLKQRMEQMKDQIKQDHKTTGFKEKFGKSQADMIESEFKRDTVGLKTKEDFKKMRETLEKKEALLQELKKEELRAAQDRMEEERRKQRKSKVLNSKLSFRMEEDEAEEESAVAASSETQVSKKAKIFKNPSVDTSFLPDREREKAELRERQRLMQEFHIDQERKQMEKIEVQFNFWDGSPHIRSVQCTRGITIGKFLGLVLQNLQEDFRELRGLASDNLLYCKQDVLIPHDLSFHTLIEKKAFGTKGIIFDIENHDDIKSLENPKIQNDSNESKQGEEKAACGKVVERRWFERNKHIFPLNKWEILDPSKVNDGTGDIMAK